MKNESVVFDWESKDFQTLVESCSKDEVTYWILRHLDKTGRIIEAGCGLGRFVKYLSDKGFDIEGIEINEEAVRALKEISPQLKITQGSISGMPYANGSIGGVICLGVIEHFFLGCEAPLKEINRILKPGGIAIITVPSFNFIRRIKDRLYLGEIDYFLNPVSILRRSVFLRKIFGKDPRNDKFKYNRGRGRYKIYPAFGEFFQYFFTKCQFEKLLADAGFVILESIPLEHAEGVYYEFGRLFGRRSGWECRLNIGGRFLNTLLSKMPFCHNHMHLCVVKKK